MDVIKKWKKILALKKKALADNFNILDLTFTEGLKNKEDIK